MGFCATTDVQIENRLTRHFRTHQSENRLINASNSTHQISYSYDYMGRRFSKVVDDGSGVTTNTFLYNGWNLISEVSNDGSSVTTNHYVWGLDLSGRMQGSGGIGGLLATVQDGDVYFSCFDANGNLTDYVDESGSNVAHYVYGPFGQTVDSTGGKVDDFRFRFSTKYLDDELGWYYYGFRFYDPEVGRWISRDPVGESLARNLYNFGRNRAPNIVDVLGLWEWRDEFTRKAQTRVNEVREWYTTQPYVCKMPGPSWEENGLPTMSYILRSYTHYGRDEVVEGVITDAGLDILYIIELIWAYLTGSAPSLPVNVSVETSYEDTTFFEISDDRELKTELTEECGCDNLGAEDYTETFFIFEFIFGDWEYVD